MSHGWRKAVAWPGARRQRWSCAVQLLVCTALAAVALASEPQDEGARLFEKHEFDKASEYFHARLRDHSQDAQALIYLGRIAFERNHLDEAERYFEKATVAAPQNAAAFHWLGRACGVQARELGAPRGLGPARRAKHALEKAVALNPNDVEARVDLATFYREAPGIVGGSKRAALQQVQEINRRDGYAGALIQGDLALDEKDYVEAERQYLSAITLQPGNTEAFYHLGIAYQRNRKYRRAFAAFEKMLEIDPQDKRALFQIGKTADLSGQCLERGAQALREYLQCRPFFVMPKLSWAHRRLGDIYAKRGQRDAAREQYLAALREDPDDDDATAALKALDRDH